MNEQTEKCSGCNGTGVGEANSFRGRELSKDDYEPIECQDCGGTGHEPK